MNNVDVDEINELAQFIRQINGDNKMGAAELAENILEWQSGKAHDVEPVGEISEINGCPTVYWDKSLPVGTKFYSRPAAKVPEETEEMVDAAVKVFEDAGADVDLGWLGEACRAYVAAASTTPQQSGEWVRCSERLPTEADADCDQEIWFCWSNNTVERRHYKRVQLDIHHDCYWMPTGLKRPNPPKQENE